MMPEKEIYGLKHASGEIDILETVNLGVPCKACPGGREDTVLGTLHFGKPPQGNVRKGKEIHAHGAHFDQPFHLILNLAFGGGLAESRGFGGIATDDFPKR
jgi:hypothetical protein